MANFTHKTITQGRKTIVFGMPWYTVDEDDSPRKAGVDLAKEVQARFDLIVARKDSAPQFGLATSVEGAKSGAYSAAAIVADLVSVESWVYVLEIESSIWICCGRDGFILPAGDRVYDNRDEARRAFHDLNPSSFKKVYLPGSWKTSGSSSEDLNDMAGDVEETDILDFISYAPPKWGKLTPISSVGSILKAIVIAALVAGVAYGGWATFTTETQVEMTSAQRAALLKAEADRIAQQNAQARQSAWAQLDSNRPWHSAPVAHEVLQKCLREIKLMPSRPVGYEVEQIQCNGDVVDASVRRTTGYTTWLEEWADAHDNISATTNSTGDTGYLTRQLAAMAPRGAEELFPFEGISHHVLQVGQIEGASVDLTTPAAAIVPNEPDYVPYYATSNYRIITSRPDSWLALFAETPGLTLTSVTLKIADQTYTMEGEIYVPNL